MTKAKWTPGPWEAKNGTDVFTTLGAANSEGIEAAHNDGWHVADCAAGWTFIEGGGTADLSFEERQANAHLIAAAPDLYEALASIENDDGSIPEAIWKMRNDALAKARGEGGSH